MPGKCSFNELWLDMEPYKLWLKRHSDKYKAVCVICRKCMAVSTMGEAALKCHARGKKHQQNLAASLIRQFSSSYPEKRISAADWIPTEPVTDVTSTGSSSLQSADVETEKELTFDQEHAENGPGLNSQDVPMAHTSEGQRDDSTPSMHLPVTAAPMPVATPVSPEETADGDYHLSPPAEPVSPTLPQDKGQQAKQHTEEVTGQNTEQNTEQQATPPPQPPLPPLQHCSQNSPRFHPYSKSASVHTRRKPGGDPNHDTHSLVINTLSIERMRLEMEKTRSEIEVNKAQTRLLKQQEEQNAVKTRLLLQEEKQNKVKARLLQQEEEQNKAKARLLQQEEEQSRMKARVLFLQEAKLKRELGAENDREIERLYHDI